MNKQGNTYTIVYIAVIVCIVGAVLAWVSLSLKPKQEDNIRIDKMQQMLSSIHVASDETNAIELYEKYITNSFVLNSEGDRLEGEAFDIDPAAEVKKPANERRLPVFEATIDKETKYILPVYGSGLWGPIWGYVSVDNDGSTVYGAFFSHKSETPGLGAEIAKPAFYDQFKGKHLFKDGEFKSIAVQKRGTKPLNDEDYVDAISGGTITSKGVQSMLLDCLKDYKPFLASLQTTDKKK